MSRIEEIASALERAERSCKPIAPLSETYLGLAPNEAYAIQSALFDMKLTQGVRWFTADLFPWQVWALWAEPGRGSVPGDAPAHIES